MSESLHAETKKEIDTCDRMLRILLDRVEELLTALQDEGSRLDNLNDHTRATLLDYLYDKLGGSAQALDRMIKNSAAMAEGIGQ
jgi:hypothetical protein